MDKLKLWISEIYYQEEDEINKNWLAWMYGKIDIITDTSYLSLAIKYGEIVEEYDQKSKDIVSEHHFTSMWKVMSYREE